MIHNAMREVGSASDFLGHLGATEFALIVSAESAPALLERVLSRLKQSLDYFYPIRDRDDAVNWDNRLAIKTAKISSCGDVAKTPTELKEKLFSLKN